MARSPLPSTPVPEADPDGLESFLPEGQDFSVLVGSELFLENIDTFLYTPNAYRDITGNILVDGGGQTGSELTVDRIEDGVGSIRSESLFSVAGSSYRLGETVNVEDNAATLILTRDLNEGIENNELLSFSISLCFRGRSSGNNADHSRVGDA